MRPLKSPNELLLWFGNSLNQSRARSSAHFYTLAPTTLRRLRKITLSPPPTPLQCSSGGGGETSLVGTYWVAIAKAPAERRALSPLGGEKTICPHAARRGTRPKQYSVPTAFLHPAAHHKSCHRRKSAPGSERGAGALNRTESNTWKAWSLWQPGGTAGGGLQASRRHLKFSAVVGAQPLPTWHSFLATELQRESLSSGEEMPEQLRR